MTNQNRLLCAGSALLALVALPIFAAAAPPPRPSDLGGGRVGNPDSVTIDLSAGPGLLLMGGGREVDAAFRDRVWPIISGGDVVVLRTSGGTGYNNYFLNDIDPTNRPNSVDTLIINTRAKADSAYVEWALANAEFIWIAGGDQSTYTDNWRGTNVETQLRAAWARGAVLGGTSAGMAVASEFIYDPGPNPSLTTASAAANPFNPSMRITDRIIDVPFMDNTITDTHFRNRDRMGRLMAMMAVLRETGRTNSIRGVAASEQSSIFINSAGLGIVDTNATGDGVYILEEGPTTQRTRVVSGQPLIYENITRWRLQQGDTFDFATGTTSITPVLISINGDNAPTVYTPPDVYADAPTGNARPELVYFEDFTRTGTLTGTAYNFVVVNGGGADTWTIRNTPAPDARQGRAASITFNTAGVKDDWMITPFFDLAAGVNYRISFWYLGGGNTTIDQFDLYIGQARSVAGMQGPNGTLLQSFTNLRAVTTPDRAFVDFTPSASGQFALGFHANSPADQNVIWIDNIEVISLDAPPQPAELAWPLDQDQQVFPETWFVVDRVTGADRYELRLGNFPSDLDDASSIIGTLESQFFLFPGTLVPGETYYLRADAINDAGRTEGPTTIFSVLPNPVNDQDVILLESFNLPLSVNGIPAGLPALPFGWAQLDADGAINNDGFAGAWFRARGNLVRSGNAALGTRFNNDAAIANDDWLFFPPIDIPPGREARVTFFARTGSVNFTETVEVRLGSFPSAAAVTTNPADYTTLLDTITLASTTYQQFSYVIPANSVQRLALRYTSQNQARFLIDDVSVVLEGDPPSRFNDWMMLAD